MGTPYLGRMLIRQFKPQGTLLGMQLIEAGKRECRFLHRIDGYFSCYYSLFLTHFLDILGQRKH